MKQRTNADLFQTGSQAAKKLVVSALIIGVFVFYSMLHNRSAASTALPVATATTLGRTSITPGAVATVQPTPTATGDTSGNSTGLYKNGTYVGAVADAQWGYIQVQVVIQNGRMADVQFLQYPDDRNRSIEINRTADPQLVREAIQAQNAQVDIVTGATDSSEAFMQSLADALSQAQA
jgi:uncharacterized protein with FMN-binding domain